MATTQKKTETPALSVTLAPMYRGEIAENDDWTGADGGWIEIVFAGGEKLAFSTDRLSNGLLYRAACHGMKQKLVDAAAIARDTTTGKSATPEDKQAAVTKVYDRLMEGEWNAPRAEGGSMSLTLAALVRLYPNKTRADLEAWLGSKSVKAQAALRTEPVVADMIATIKAERAASKPGVAGVDVAGLLSELDDAEPNEDGEEDEPSDE
jgi:hypothetical protein